MDVKSSLGVKTISELSVKDVHEVEWELKGFFSHTETDKRYNSRIFSIPGSDWYLQIYPNGKTSNNSSGFISLYLRRIDDLPSPVKAFYSFGVKRADGTVEKLNSDITYVFEKGGEGYGCPRSLERSVLLQRKSELAPSSILTLTCTLRTEKGFFRNPETLSRDFSDLFTTKKNCDATLVVQGKEYPVHRNILSARSSVLAAMFEVDMKEKTTGVAEIPDCDPGAFGEFLTYLYSGRLEGDPSNVLELYKIAHKYDVEELQSSCCKFLVSRLSVQNVLEAAVLGDYFGEKEVIRGTQKFFNENYRKIISTTQWSEFLFKKTRLADKLFKNMAKETAN